MIPKVRLLEFVTSDFFNESGWECGKHYAELLLKSLFTGSK